MRLVPRSDEQLLRAYLQGDAAAMEDLLRRYQDRMLQFVIWKIDGSRQEAEDIAQEVFLQAVRSAPSFSGRSRFKTWLYGLAENVCRHWVRGVARRRRVMVAAGPDEEMDPERADGRPSALDNLQKEERGQAVRRAVQALPADQREVLLLRDWEEMSYAEIGEVLGVPLGTVKSRVHHGRLQLARSLHHLKQKESR